MSGEGWLLVFMMLALKLPIVYLGLVVWYAIKAEPLEPGQEEADYSLWRPWRNRPAGPRPRRGGPHGTRDSARAVRSRRDRVTP